MRKYNTSPDDRLPLLHTTTSYEYSSYTFVQMPRTYITSQFKTTEYLPLDKALTTLRTVSPHCGHERSWAGLDTQNTTGKQNIQWQPMTAYLFEPSAHQAVRHAHEDFLNGDQHHAFVPSDDTNCVEDCDKAIPSGTQVVVRPRFPRVSYRYLTTISSLNAPLYNLSAPLSRYSPPGLVRGSDTAGLGSSWS